jgi:hypothetical protein
VTDSEAQPSCRCVSFSLNFGINTSPSQAFRVLPGIRPARSVHSGGLMGQAIEKERRRESRSHSCSRRSSNGQEGWTDLNRRHNARFQMPGMNGLDAVRLSPALPYFLYRHRVYRQLNCKDWLELFHSEGGGAIDFGRNNWMRTTATAQRIGLQCSASSDLERCHDSSYLGGRRPSPSSGRV